MINYSPYLMLNHGMTRSSLPGANKLIFCLPDCTRIIIQCMMVCLVLPARRELEFHHHHHNPRLPAVELSVHQQLCISLTPVS